MILLLHCELTRNCCVVKGRRRAFRITELPEWSEIDENVQVVLFRATVFGNVRVQVPFSGTGCETPITQY